MPIAKTVPGTSSGRMEPRCTRAFPRKEYSSVARAVSRPVAVLSSATMAESEMLLHSSAGKLAEPNSSSCTVRRV